MVVKYVVCPNKYGPLADITFHRFPHSAGRCKQWAVLCRLNDLTDVDPTVCNRLYKLCSRHFDESQFIGTRLIHNAVPSKFEWNGYLNEQKEITNESNNLEVICPQLEVTEHCSPIGWSNIQSTSTTKSNSVAKSLIGSFSSKASSASSNNTSCQTTQSLSSHTPWKDNLQKMLSRQKSKYNELLQKF